jgi:DNA-binding NtrC family response regulator
LLVSHYWSGNVRELKNIAEQISVLSTEKMITADVLQGFLPQRNTSRSLQLIPSAAQKGMATTANTDFNTERDILYKLFFDLKKDMNDLKHMIYDVAQHQGYTPADPSSGGLVPVYNEPEPVQNNNTGYNNPTPIFLEANAHHEEIEETLALADREKEFIVKALKKHKGRRRDAAAELGISERTLYRKIKEYNIDE